MKPCAVGAIVTGLQPQVIFTMMEPLAAGRDARMDVPEAAVGSCEKLGTRRADTEHGNERRWSDSAGIHRALRGLIGFRGEFIRATRGEGIMSIPSMNIGDDG